VPTLSPILTTTPNTPSNYNVGMAETLSWIPIEGAGRPLYAQATYTINPANLTLSPGSITIGAIEIKDGNSSIVADVETVGGGNALRVLTQELDPISDTISIGDKNGNNVTVNSTTSSLNVHLTNTVNVSGSVSLTNQLTGITVLNPVTSVSVMNQLTSMTVSNPVTSVSVSNLLSSFTVLNPISSIFITNQLTGIAVTNDVQVHASSTFPISGSVTVLNPITSISITNQLTGITVLNPVTSISVSNFPTQLSSVSITNQLTGITVLNPITQVTTLPQPTQLDAFGRLRVSSPMTLFDSSHRYKDNNLWSTLSANGGSVSFNASQGLMELNVTNTAGASAIRETTKVFSYQPGKSLLVMNTFVMASSATNLRQRVGYFGEQNGIYFQLDDGNISIVKRSLVTGSIAESVVSQSNWNGDKLDGTGSSGIVLDITKAQILWTDIEWLGVGTVRVGFVINGQFIVCHSFHHANIIDSTYTTTASLPLRYEIINKGATDGSRTMKQICSTVISEGGYELRGLQQAVSIPITAPRTFAVAGTFYPIISIRLKNSPDRLDAIAILTALSILGQGNGINYNWQVKASGVTTGGSWVDAGVDSAVQYNITGTSYAGGRILASGFLNSSNQGSPNLDILKEALFKFQLERNDLTKTPFELTLIAATDTSNNSGMFASMDWEEISR
jgi:hypothetical protein